MDTRWSFCSAPRAFSRENREGAVDMANVAKASGPSFAPVGTDLPHGIVEVASYHGVLEILRSPKFVTELNDGTGPVRGHTMLRLNGPAHTSRRRAMNHLVRQDYHRRFRETALYPTLRRNIDQILRDRDEDGVARADLADLVAKTSLQLAAAMIGLSETDRVDRLEELQELVDALRPVAGVRWVIDPAEKAQIMDRAVAAKDAFGERFFAPALAARRALLQRHEAGELLDAELPRDFLTLVAAHADAALVEGIGARFDPELGDTDVAVREAVVNLIGGGVDTTTFTLTWCVQELSDWLASHPEDVPLCTDETFLYRAVAESTRLHPVFPAFMREALEDVELSDGRTLRAGDLVALRTGLASRDAAVYGPDADEFNPRREMARAAMPYGLAFGSGTHMCYGMPIVLGNEGVDGSLVYFLRALYKAGMQPDPARPPQAASGTYVERYASYPVLFA